MIYLANICVTHVDSHKPSNFYAKLLSRDFLGNVLYYVTMNPYVTLK